MAPRRQHIHPIGLEFGLHALAEIPTGNGHAKEDIRVCVAGGADGIRIAKCEGAQDVKTVEEHVAMAEEEDEESSNGTSPGNIFFRLAAASQHRALHPRLDGAVQGTFVHHRNPGCGNRNGSACGEP